MLARTQQVRRRSVLAERNRECEDRVGDPAELEATFTRRMCKPRQGRSRGRPSQGPRLAVQHERIANGRERERGRPSRGRERPVLEAEERSGDCRREAREPEERDSLGTSVEESRRAGNAEGERGGQAQRRQAAPRFEPDWIALEQ